MLCLNAKCRQEVSDDFVFCPWCGKKLHPPEKKTKSRGNGLGTVYKLPNGKWCAEKTLGWLVDPLPEDAPPGTVPHKRRVSVKRSYSTRKEAMAALPYLTASDVHPRSGSLTQRKGTSISLKELYDHHAWLPDVFPGLFASLACKDGRDHRGGSAGLHGRRRRRPPNS